jgi:hypothetical protein
MDIRTFFAVAACIAAASASRKTPFLEFRAKCEAAHPSLLDYRPTAVDFVNMSTPASFRCVKCGLTFKRPPGRMLRPGAGHGCTTCRGGVKDTLESFIQKARQTHGETFRYHLVRYVNSQTAVDIVCPNDHVFRQTPCHHIDGDGCRKCGGYYRSLEDIISLSKERFGPENQFDFSNFVFVDMTTRGCLTCPYGHSFTTTASVHLRGDGGCEQCARKKNAEAHSYTQDQWLEKAKEVHGADTYDYTKTLYRGQKSKVIITCRTHGDFEQGPTSHTEGNGCPKCGIEKTRNAKYLTNDDILAKYEECSTVHKDRYRYTSLSRDRLGRLILTVECPTHGHFEQRVDHHRNGHGCPDCPVRYSKWSLEYFAYRSVTDGIIQTGPNGGEFRVPEWPTKTVDGYRSSHREITECQGSYHHGDPRVCDHAERYKGGQVTLGDKYKRSCESIAKLRELGYMVIEVWEYDWTKFKNAIVRIQRAFRHRQSDCS